MINYTKSSFLHFFVTLLLSTSVTKMIVVVRILACPEAKADISMSLSFLGILKRDVCYNKYIYAYTVLCRMENNVTIYIKKRVF